MNFYKTKKWKLKRKRVLRRDGYECQESKRYGKTEPATTVHHIYPLELYPELALVDWNLISLTDSKHNAMHDRVTGQITELGNQWQARQKEQFEEWQRQVSPHPSSDFENSLNTGWGSLFQ